MFTNRYGTHFVISRWPTDRVSEFLSEGHSYDCFVVNRHDHLTVEEIGVVAATLAKSRCNWIEIFGYGAERLHDAVDEAAVVIGRQSKVGDGDPMTTWNEELTADGEIAEYLWTGGQGDSDWKLLMVVGDEDAERQLTAKINWIASAPDPQPRS